jgi:alkylhydroperoxidase family enzyme
VTEHLDELRALDSAAPPPPAGLAPYVEKVRSRAWTITDAEVESLKQAGFSEDEIFEATAAAAISEGLRRLDAALEVIG